MAAAVPTANAISTGPVLVVVASVDGAAGAGAGTVLMLGFLSHVLFAGDRLTLQRFAVDGQLGVRRVQFRSRRRILPGRLDADLGAVGQDDPANRRLGPARPVQPGGRLRLLDRELQVLVV